MSQSDVAVIVIGRNEGERLVRCLRSVLGQVATVVYVDSASTDGSVDVARGLGVDVVELDMSVPFSAARARNAGADRLRTSGKDVRYLQFVDGDCELQPDWIGAAIEALEAHPDTAVVCGRRRERFPAASPYNRLCDIEWNTPVGFADACGGDFLVRREAFETAGGFDPAVIAGEEPELCFRLRTAGWRILRIDHEMTLHDAAMSRFGQWWQRTKRSGYAYALGFAMHGASAERFRRRNVLSIVVWGGMLPLACFVVALAAGLLPALLVLALYPIQARRILASLRKGGELSEDHARLYAIACVAGKVPEFIGVLRCCADGLLRRRPRIIEYKS